MTLALMGSLLPVFANSTPASAAAPANVQFTYTGGSASNTSSAVFSSPVTAGNTIVMMATWDPAAAPSTITCNDTLNNTYTTVAYTSNQAEGDTQSLAACYSSNIKGGSDTVTISLGVSLGCCFGISAYEYSGIAGTSPVDTFTVKHASLGSGGTDAAVATTGTTTTNGDLIFGAYEFPDNPTMTAGTGFTQRYYNNPGYGDYAEDAIQPTAGSLTATASPGAATNYTAIIIAFKPANVITYDTVNLTVDAALSFAVSSHAGTCNGVTQSSGTTVSATQVRLPHVSAAATSNAAQDLTVATNAGNGFTVYIRSAGPLTDGSGHSITALGSSNASPSSFPSIGTAGFGYTVSGALSGGTPNRFKSPATAWAGITGTNAEVAYSTAAVTSTVSCIDYQVGVAAASVAGNYASTIIYTAIPTF